MKPNFRTNDKPHFQELPGSADWRSFKDQDGPSITVSTLLPTLLNSNRPKESENA